MEQTQPESLDPCDSYCMGVADPVILDDDRVLRNLKQHEQFYQITSCYFKCVQTDLEPYMRKIVATWLLEVCEEEKCEDEVFSLAMNLLDRFLSIAPIQKTQLQLLATACLLISSKYLRFQHLSAQRLVMFTDYSITLEELTSWELLVLNKLQWDIHSVTANDFLKLMLRRLHRLPVQKRKLVKKHAQIFITLCAAEVKFAFEPPSLIASACLALALHGLDSTNEFYSTLSTLQHISGIDSKKIEQTIHELDRVISSNRLRNLDESTSYTSESASNSSSANTDYLLASENNRFDSRPIPNRITNGGSLSSSPLSSPSLSTLSSSPDLSSFPLSDNLLATSPISSTLTLHANEHVCLPTSPICACSPPTSPSDSNYSLSVNCSPLPASTSLSSVFAACRASLEECGKTLGDTRPLTLTDYSSTEL